MASETKLKQAIKYNYVVDELGNVVSAKDLTKEAKASHTYYIRGINEEGNQGLEEVIPVLSEKKQKHFRRYTDKTAKSISRVHVNQREFSEHLIHKLAKQLFENRKIDRISLPEDILNLDMSRISSSKTAVMSISSCEIEKRIKSASGNYIIADILCTLVNGKQLIVEMVATHNCSTKKIDTIKELGIDTIEIDISDMISDKPLSEDVETALIHRISFKELGTKWVYNTKKEELSSFFNNIVIFKLNKTRFNSERDGDWYTWAGSRVEDIPHCRYNEMLSASDGTDNERSMLTQRNCTGCERMLYVDWNGQYGEMACNQSTMSNKEFMKHIAYISGKMIK